MMNRCPPLQLLLLPLILLHFKCASTTWLQGDPAADYNLECVNDYLFTINCSLNVNTSVSNKTFWLAITDTMDRREYKCLLTNTTAVFFCSIDRSLMPDDDYTETFTDLDEYDISLCQSQDNKAETCELLEEEYMPALHIKPNAPCCLTVSHNSSRHHFTWKSTYEKHSSETYLAENLMYQLQIYQTGGKHRLRTNIINRNSRMHSVEDENFDPDTEYAAKVRSSPNMGHYKGQWSDWSSEVLWRTEAAADAVPVNGFIYNLPMVFVILCAVMVLLLVCYGSARKWEHSTFIPTPAPYFHTLYKDCQGDFKSWVVMQENPAEVLKAEEALHIDTLIECVEVQDYEYPATFPQQLMENRAYSNIPSSVFDADLLSMQHPDGSTMVQLLDQRRSVRSLPGCCKSCSPVQDSGCWLCSDTSLEESSWYCNEYCTLSCLQQDGCVAPGHHGNLKTHPASQR
ncbi:hypothetical protein ILYODFUR_016160 [Ilyodon furcidens]|uniref:Fibronectin type-III domain-containing protein n=1 Tax=Ilyodon furcidens TaxID=33524 RepID=A0ABV0U8J0_9TELE